MGTADRIDRGSDRTPRRLNGRQPYNNAHRLRHRPGVVRLRRTAVCDRLLRRQARGCRPQHHRQSVHLRAVARRLLHVMDFLRQRGTRRHQRHRFFTHLPGTDSDGGAVVVCDAENDPHQQGQPHHVNRRLRGVALRQKPVAGRPRDDYRGDRHRALHLAAVESRFQQFFHHPQVPGHRHARQPVHDTAAHRQYFLYRAAAGGIHHPVRHAPSRRLRASRRPGCRNRLRIRGQTAGLHRGRRICDLRAVRRFCRYFFERHRISAPRQATRLRRQLRRLHVVGIAHLPVHARNHVPAAPVPDRSG